MNKRSAFAAGSVTVAVVVSLTGCAFGGGAPAETDGDDGPVTITFQSLAYQDTTIAATEEIVDSWNADNPDIQVELTQGSWDNVHDQLVTQFQGGTAPDVIHNESSDILGFAEQGYLADLTDYLSEETLSGVSDDVWSTVTSNDGAIIAAPTLLQTYVVYANTTAFEEAGVEVPAGDELTWDQLQGIAADLTGDGKFGVGWGLKQPTAAVMNTALGFDGTFFEGTGSDATIDVGDDELAVPEYIHAMAHNDKSLDPITLTQSGSEVLPGFLGGTYAMYVGGNFLAQQISESAPEGFEWKVLPPLAGTTGPVQAANPQTMSVAAESDHIEQAAEFVDYFVGASNLAKLAQGDWLIPVSSEGRAELETVTGGENGWTEILATGENLSGAPFQKATNYPQWKDQYATPGLQQYFSNSITLEELKKQLTDGWASIG